MSELQNDTLINQFQRDKTIQDHIKKLHHFNCIYKAYRMCIYFNVTQTVDWRKRNFINDQGLVNNDYFENTKQSNAHYRTNIKKALCSVNQSYAEWVEYSKGIKKTQSTNQISQLIATTKDMLGNELRSVKKAQYVLDKKNKKQHKYK